MFHVILHYSLLCFIILDKWKKAKFIKFNIFIGKAVGIRNFPDKGKDAEEFLRTAFEIQIRIRWLLFTRSSCLCGHGLWHR